MQRSKEAKMLLTAAKSCSAPAFALLFLLVAGHWSPVAATTVTGTIKDPAGTGSTGTVELKLSAPGRVADPALLLIQPTVKCTLAGGVLGSCTVRGNDTITDPAGTYYCVRIVSANGQELMAGKKYIITGASFDLGAVLPGGLCQ